MLKLLTAVSLLAILSGLAAAQTHNHGVLRRPYSHKAYADPFNEVDVDVIFFKGGENWRVPTFGGEAMSGPCGLPLPPAAATPTTWKAQTRIILI